MKTLICIFLTLLVITSFSMVPISAAQGISGERNMHGEQSIYGEEDEEDDYLINEIETLNQLRELRRDLKRLNEEVERAERIIRQYEQELLGADKAAKLGEQMQKKAKQIDEIPPGQPINPPENADPSVTP